MTFAKALALHLDNSTIIDKSFNFSSHIESICEVVNKILALYTVGVWVEGECIHYFMACGGLQ